MMKPLLACLLVMVLTVSSFAEDADRFSPAVPLEDALVLAKGYVREKKIETSGYYLKFIELKFEKNGKSHHWEAQWMTGSKLVKGDWFIVRVEMDKSCSLVHGM
jgi:hypothetical protein